MEQLSSNVIEEYFDKIGLKEENDRDEFFKKIDEKHKVNLTQNLDLAVSLRKDNGSGKIYNIKNKDLETSMDFAGYYHDLYRQFFTWIMKGENLDGKKILDLGCDNGITTCFVAGLYPNAQIVAVDKCKKGIKCAEEIAQKLELKNVRFESVDAKKVDKFFKEEKFDVVLSNRSMLEITNLPKLKSFWSIDEVEDSIMVANSVVKFFKSVEKVMADDAKLITFERLEGVEEILNFVKSMRESGLYIDTDSMCKIQFKELNDVEQMPLIVFDKTERREIGFYEFIEIYSKLPILNKQTDVEDEFKIELDFKALGKKELVYGTQIDYKTGVGSERREVWQVGDKFVSYKYSNVGRRELITEGIEKDKAITEIRAMSNFIGRIGHKVTEYHSLEEREKLVK
ncbi:class I SAM-dependent methyltransferase [Intestinibacter bartlettii]|uniref:Class I SAM-dependent methyltransferase n=1 Tax=Intestinibacter bartlettii TaxID=261299 RepID=A0ABS6DUS0_9FIRM|nr:class I SAM-dependent methyltransferase [Intestinibacter bartlettii]MBU5335495.1 class I SAM-dependent methyltransferase [Intestinibacter bartlettii]